MRQLEVIATDGKIQKRVLWIDVRPKGIYCGWTGLKDGHYSYHTDGNLFRTQGDRVTKVAKLQPLTDLHGEQRFVSFVFPTAISSSVTAPNYKMQPLRSIAYVDVRRYLADKKYVGVTVSALEPMHFETIHQPIPPFIESHVFMEFNPWILIQFYMSSFYARTVTVIAPRMDRRPI